MSLRAGLSYNITEDAVEGFEDLGSLGKTRRPANHGLVFMVRGLVGKWKQAVLWNYFEWGHGRVYVTWRHCETTS